MRVLLTFYRSISIVSVFISLLCVVMYLYSKSYTIVMIAFWTKVITNSAQILYIHFFRSEDACFFQNLGFGTVRLYVLAFVFDLGIWAVLTFLTLLVIR